MITRRKFIKQGLLISAVSMLFPPALRANSNAPVPASMTPDPSSWKNDEINIAWIGHATVLINFYGTIIITDPVLFTNVGIYFAGFTIGPARFTAPALEFDEIPKPDIILLSHAHMDHMDYKTLASFSDKWPKQIDVITAYNTQDVIYELEWKSLTEMDWNDTYSIGDINFKALEVKHFGWRYPWEKDRSKGFMKNGRSYNSYVIEKNGKRILFGGDTAFSTKFKEADLQDIETAIMPVGAYNPWKFNHCNPEEALVMASEHIKAKYFVPIHCNTFKQGMEPIDEPLKWVAEAYSKYNIKLGVENIGGTLTLSA